MRSSVDGHRDRFHTPAIVNSTAIDMDSQVPLCCIDLGPLGMWPGVV